MSDGIGSGTSTKFLGHDEVYVPHRPAYNDPYANFELIRTVWPKKKEPEVRSQESESTEVQG